MVLDQVQLLVQVMVQEQLLVLVLVLGQFLVLILVQEQMEALVMAQQHLAQEQLLVLAQEQLLVLVLVLAQEQLLVQTCYTIAPPALPQLLEGLAGYSQHFALSIRVQTCRMQGEPHLRRLPQQLPDQAARSTGPPGKPHIGRGNSPASGWSPHPPEPAPRRWPRSNLAQPRSVLALPQ